MLINQAYRYNNTLGEVVLGMRADGDGGWEVVSRAGRYISIALGDPEDPTLVTMAQPYVDLLAAYNNTVIGQTTAPIDALQAYTQETNGANLQADAAVWELEDQGMASRRLPPVGRDEQPEGRRWRHPGRPGHAQGQRYVHPHALRELARGHGDERSAAQGGAGARLPQLLLLQVCARLRRLLLLHHLHDRHQRRRPDHLRRYLSDAAVRPNQEYVVSLVFDGQEVDFDDADTYYRVSTVNYLAAGSCNFNDGGVSLWPLDQIVNDTQFYVRDSVIHYIPAMGIVSPAIEGRLQFITDLERSSNHDHLTAANHVPAPRLPDPRL